ncbi:hypothetical protein GCM10022236_46350 [Microlunatus ginsengisoli]|uniref:Uncharacterized protein n=1 Tax=Microlunatus ginsengisoli TaxID=363863 RepID=A0ABP7AR41_9ACTN
MIVRGSVARDAGVEGTDLADEPLSLGVLEVEDLLTGPVQVVGDVRDLFVQTIGRVRQDSPRRPPETSTAKWWSQEGQVTVARVWPSVFTRR